MQYYYPSSTDEPADRIKAAAKLVADYPQAAGRDELTDLGAALTHLGALADEIGHALAKVDETAREKLKHGQLKAGSPVALVNLLNAVQYELAQAQQSAISLRLHIGAARTHWDDVTETTTDRCSVCRNPFNADDPWSSLRQFYDKPYCRGCADHCHDNESADHRCQVCWDYQKEKVRA